MEMLLLHNLYFDVNKRIKRSPNVHSEVHILSKTLCHCVKLLLEIRGSHATSLRDICTARV